MGSRPCTICINRQKTDINAAVEAGDPFGVIATRFGVKQSSLQRHAVNCMRLRRREKMTTPPPALDDEPSPVRFDACDADNPKALIGVVAGLLTHALDRMARATRAKDERARAAAEKEAREGVTLLMKVQGMLTGDGVVVNIDARQVNAELDGMSLADLHLMRAMLDDEKPLAIAKPVPGAGDVIDGEVVEP